MGQYQLVVWKRHALGRRPPGGGGVKGEVGLVREEGG
jgi:hypothetical protein